MQGQFNILFLIGNKKGAREIIANARIATGDSSILYNIVVNNLP